MAKITIQGNEKALRNYLSMIEAKMANPETFADYGVWITVEDFENTEQVVKALVDKRNLTL